MKYLIALGLTIAGFVGGVYYENHRKVGELDKIIAIMLSRQAIDNSSYQTKVNSEYIELLQRQEYQVLADRIRSNSEILAEIKETAESICIEVQCTEEQRAYFSGGRSSGD